MTAASDLPRLGRLSCIPAATPLAAGFFFPCSLPFDSSLSAVLALSVKHSPCGHAAFKQEI